MAADQLDRLWDCWLAELSASAARAKALLAAGETAMARAEIHQKYMGTVRALYESTVSTAPLRYAKVADWGAWSRGFYILAVKADKTFQGKAVAPMHEALDALRAHFTKLHEAAGMRLAGDVIDEFNREVNKEKASLEALKRLRAALDKATPPRTVKGAPEPEGYEKAKRAWAEAVDPVLNGSNGSTEATAKTMTAGKKKKLREATGVFQRAFGAAYE